jgi:hypothetical protein
MRLVVLVVLFVAMGCGASVSASWRGSIGGVSVFLWYVADVEVIPSKSGVWWPGEEVEVYYIAKKRVVGHGDFDSSEHTSGRGALQLEF